IVMPSPVPLRLSAAFPVFLSVTACVAAFEPTTVLVNVRLAGERLTAGPVPASVWATVCGEPVTLSAMLTAAFNVPGAAGLKVTVIAQLAPAATLAPQPLVCEKELALVPAIVMPS